ncbi:MAG: protein kinase, partial [Akkermansia sp.]|nr:protein kinase [Akkermansia sp.]
MSQRAEIWQCPVCAARLDVTDLGFYAEIVCQQCGHTDHVHTLLANFRLEGVLGVGGMSIVLRGKDVVLGRPVAIKLLNETYRNQPERIARFENECSMMAKVRHENVVAVYSAGWAKDQFYIAMELLEGRNLETIVTEKGPLPMYASMFRGSLGSKRKLWKLAKDMAVLLCISLAITPAFRMKFWNIGAEGQVLVGCLATTACLFYLGGKVPDAILIALMLVTALLAGAVWGVIPALFKAKWKTNETLFTLMMNYVAT